MMVPSFEQKQYGNVHSAGSHFFAKSIGASVTGAGAIQDAMQRQIQEYRWSNNRMKNREKKFRTLKKEWALKKHSWNTTALMEKKSHMK